MKPANTVQGLAHAPAIAGLCLSMLMASLDTSIANSALPALSQAFGASIQRVQWVVLAYLLAVTCLVAGAGRLGDLVGRRRLFLAGIGLFTLASLLCAAAPTLGLLLAARAAQGAAAAVMLALTPALMRELAPAGQSGGALGLLGTMSAVGTSLGPTLGGLLTAGAGWRAIFLVNLPLGIVNLALIYRGLPPDAPRAHGKHEAFDWTGMLLLAATLGAFSLALTLGDGSTGPLNVALLLAAAYGVLLFVLAEHGTASPLIPLPLFQHRAISAALAMQALVAIIMMGTLVVGPFHLAGALGLGPAQAGLALSVGPLVAALAGVPAGRCADRFGVRRVILAGLLAVVCGATLLAVLPASSGLPGYLLPLALMTSGYALFQTANTSAILAASSPDYRGAVAGLLALARNLGLIVGAALMGALFAAAGMRVAFGTAAATAALAVAIASLRTK